VVSRAVTVAATVIDAAPGVHFAGPDDGTGNAFETCLLL
jgi:hypothetical protein